MFNKVLVIGLGYIGLLIVVVLVFCGLDVVGVDVNVYVVDIINKGEIYIVELDFDIVVCSVVMIGKFKVILIVEFVDVFLVVVFIFFKGDNYEFDFSYIEVVVKIIVFVFVKGNLVVLESIFLVGIIEKLV